jgi:hypothetical protein
MMCVFAISNNVYGVFARGDLNNGERLLIDSGNICASNRHDNYCGALSDRPVPPPNYGSTQSTQTLRHQHLGPRSPKFGGELAHIR